MFICFPTAHSFLALNHLQGTLLLWTYAYSKAESAKGGVCVCEAERRKREGHFLYHICSAQWLQACTFILSLHLPFFSSSPSLFLSWLCLVSLLFRLMISCQTYVLISCIIFASVDLTFSTPVSFLFPLCSLFSCSVSWISAAAALAVFCIYPLFLLTASGIS